MQGPHHDAVTSSHHRTEVGPSLFARFGLVRRTTSGMGHQGGRRDRRGERWAQLEAGPSRESRPAAALRTARKHPPSSSESSKEEKGWRGREDRTGVGGKGRPR